MHAVQHLGHHHKGHSGCPTGGRKLLLAAGQLPQGHGVAKVAPGNDDFIHQRQKLRQCLHARKVFDFGKDFQPGCTGFCQRLPQAADILSAAHKGQHDPGNAAIGGDGKVFLVLGGQGGHLDVCPRCRQTFAALQHPAPHYGAHERVRLCGVHSCQQLAVIQQQLLPRLHAVHQRSRAGDTLRAQTHGLPGGQGQRLRQTADAQFRPLQVDEQLFDPGFMQHLQPVLVRCQRPVRKIHADAGHAGFHHLLQKLYIGTGRADGSVKIHNSSCNSRFLSIVA